MDEEENSQDYLCTDKVIIKRNYVHDGCTGEVSWGEIHEVGVCQETFSDVPTIVTCENNIIFVELCEKEQNCVNDESKKIF